VRKYLEGMDYIQHGVLMTHGDWIIIELIAREVHS
jgi:hypothetical protein